LSLVQDANQPIYIPGGSTQTNSQSRRPNTQISAINQEVDSGSSNYNAVEVTYRHRTRGGFTLSSTFNWSRCLDEGSSPANVLLTGGAKIPIPGNPAFNYGRCDFDQALTWRTSGVWTLPWFAHGSGFKRTVLGGWQLSGIFTADTGQPFSVTSPFNQSFTGNGLDRADRVPGQSLTLPSGRSEQAKVAQFFNTAAFTENAPGTFGNSGRNILSSPDYVDIDSALVKGTQLTERFKLDLRFEFFNLFNHTQFLPPISGLSSTLGKLTGARDPRILQGSVKLFF
jgi:hypothetical protein